MREKKSWTSHRIVEIRFTKSEKEIKREKYLKIYIYRNKNTRGDADRTSSRITASHANFARYNFSSLRPKFNANNFSPVTTREHIDDTFGQKLNFYGSQPACRKAELSPCARFLTLHFSSTLVRDAFVLIQYEIVCGVIPNSPLNTEATVTHGISLYFTLHTILTHFAII